MARAPAPAAAPMMAPADQAMDPNAAPMDAAASEDTGGDMPTVICTVLMNPDGPFQLVEGDENEAIHGGEEMAEGEGAEQVPSQTFDSVGPLLKAILDMVQTAQDGGESGADQMRAGYAGDEAATPPTGM